MAKFSYDQREDDELSFKKGEKLEIIKEFIDEWSMVKSLATGHKGLVPHNFIAKEEDDELSESESLELFHFAMTKNVDMPKIKEIKTCDNIDRASLFLKLIKQDPFLLDQLRSAKSDSKLAYTTPVVYNTLLFTSPFQKKNGHQSDGMMMVFN